jgi:hypothetical protein
MALGHGNTSAETIRDPIDVVGSLLAIGRLVRHGGTVRVLLTTTRKENLVSENRSSGEGLFWSTSIAAGALALLHQLVQARPAPTDVPDQAATSQSSLMNWISPETLGLHKGSLHQTS